LVFAGGHQISIEAEAPTRASRGITGASRAAELATRAIEKIADSSAPADERDQRRRRLTKGPQEFREDRVDLPKRKR
jgi:hypothetical protein